MSDTQLVCSRGHVTELDGHEPESQVIGAIAMCVTAIQVNKQWQACGLAMDWRRSRPTIPHTRPVT